MSVVVTSFAPEPSELLDAQLAFHLSAGASAAVLGAASEPAAAALRERARDDAVHVAVVDGAAALGRVAVTEHGAEWVIALEPGELWWPRGESLVDVLAPMPDRYGVVQGLIREFVAAPTDGDRPWASATARRSLLVQPPPPGTAPASLLRPAFRAHPGLDVAAADGGPGARQPLRAWYPIEVLTLPLGETIDRGALDAGLVEGALVLDERARDALAAIAAGGAPAFRVPDVVDDAAYAGECAAVGEVDLESLDQQIRRLEQRVAELEARLWPRVRRLAVRAARRVRHR